MAVLPFSRSNFDLDLRLSGLWQFGEDEISIPGNGICNQIPEPRKLNKVFLNAANVTLPESLPNIGIQITPKKK